MNGRIILVQGDITWLDVDAIVNAANTTLLGGGGVDGAIHRAAGKELLEECKTLGGCETGQAKITKGYNLKAKYVIHTVGPVWRGGSHNEESLLRQAYLNSLIVGTQYQCRTIAFPNISTGVYGFPKSLAAQIATQTVKEYLLENQLPEKIYFVAFDTENFVLYKALLDVQP